MTEDGVAEKSGAKNTDTELWREISGEYYSDSVHVTESGGIGINCGGFVIVRSARGWHELWENFQEVQKENARLEEDNQLLRRKIENHIIMSEDWKTEYNSWLDKLNENH